TGNYGYPASAYILLASFLPILSAADVKDGDALSQVPNGTGAFKFVEQRGDESILAANDDFFKGRPKLDEVRFAYMGDANTRVLALLGGEADIIERLEPEQHDTLVNESSVKVKRTVSTENKYLHFRCNKAPFDDVRVRMAACNAIDRSIITEIMGAAGHASSSYVSPVKLGGGDIANYPVYDPENCQRLLAEAGFPGGKGLPELEYITSTGFYPKTKEYGEVITALMQEQGFNVKLTVLETAVWAERIYQPESGDPAGHMVDVGWSTGSPEPDLVLRPMWHSSKSLITGIKDPDLDKALDAEQAEGDTAKRLDLVANRLMPLMAEKVPSLSLFTSVLIHGINKNLDGGYFYANGPIDLSKASYI
ncbi:MAG: ABC transporter substrate-binding protein, partial [Rhodobacteraceae bacterium]|nr:ABC transporter substrate-binding protein [Paracoccaceae bacterium]